MILSERQQTAVRLLADGLTQKQIARAMGISPDRVKEQLHIARLKMGAVNAAQLATKAAKAGLL